MLQWHSRTAIRFLSYGTLILLLFQTLVMIAGTGDDALGLFIRPKPTDVFGTSEFSTVELLQTALLFASIAVTGWYAASLPQTRPMTTVIALFLVLLLVREQDYHIDQWLPWGTWLLPAALVAICLAFVAWRSRLELRLQGDALATSAAFGLLFAGLLILVGFSRIFGQTGLWTALLEDDYQRIVKLAAEEKTELLGYCLLLAGCIELRYSPLRRASGHQDDDRGQ